MAKAKLPLLYWSPREQSYLMRGHAATGAWEVVFADELWQHWLETLTSLAFESRAGLHCTLRKERLQRGDVYWYVYRSIAGHTKKRYLGRSYELTLARLEEVSARFPQPQKEVAGTIVTPQRLLSADERSRPRPELPLLESRLHPPQLPVLLVERPQLFIKLDACLTHRLSLLLAPAGFGKTTLVHQWLVLRATTPTLAWLSLDAGDNDPLRFWQYVITTCQALLGETHKAAGEDALRLFTSAAHTPFEALPMDKVLTLLLNGLTAAGSGGLLILDDYHTITDARIHKTLAFFVDHLPTSVHILLLSRAEPPLPLLRWRARGELYELQRNDLRFSLVETRHFLDQALPLLEAPSEAALTRLDVSLEGWPAGLRLLTLALSTWHDSQAVEQALLSLGKFADFSFPQRSLLDYFVSEILEAQSETTQVFLLQTSVLSRFNSQLCNTLTGRGDSADQLEQIRRAGLFLEALEGPGEWYRYHALFAEAMRREASRRLGEETLRALSTRASCWYEQENLPGEAIEAAWQAREMERLADLLEKANESSLSQPANMLFWLEQLPQAILRAHPLLCHLYAVELRFPTELRLSSISHSQVASLPGEISQQVEDLLLMAEEGWRRQGKLAWIGCNAGFRTLSALLDGESFSALVKHAHQGLALLTCGPEPGDYPLKMYRSSCAAFVAIEKLRLGQVNEALPLLLQAQKDNVSPNNWHLATFILFALGKSYVLQGELQRARANFLQVLANWQKLQDDEGCADVYVELAGLAFEENDLSQLEEYLNAALEKLQRLQTPQPALPYRIQMQQALLLYARGENAEALAQLSALLARSRDASTSSIWPVKRLHAWQGRLQLLSGDGSGLQSSLPVDAQVDENGKSLTEYLAEESLRARVWLAQDQARQALPHLARLLLTARENRHGYAALEIQLLVALAHEACQESQQAHSWLRRTLQQALPQGYLRLFLNEGKPLLRLLRSLLGETREKALSDAIQVVLRASLQGEKQTYTPSLDGLLSDPLTAQEERILRLLTAGWNNAEIARELIISVNTVKYHIKHLYQKLGVHNRFQASAFVHTLLLTKDA